MTSKVIYNITNVSTSVIATLCFISFIESKIFFYLLLFNQRHLPTMPELLISKLDIHKVLEITMQFTNLAPNPKWVGVVTSYFWFIRLYLSMYTSRRRHAQLVSLFFTNFDLSWFCSIFLVQYLYNPKFEQKFQLNIYLTNSWFSPT